MQYFHYKKNKLYCEGVALKKLALEFGTPLYVYSQRTIVEHFLKLKKAFAKLNPLICYSVKANSNLSILNILIKAGAGLDIVSGGELYRAQKIKCNPDKIVYASVGKTRKEIVDAMKYGIFMFNVESVEELSEINAIAMKLKKKVNVALRINPDVTSKTHAYITTGKKGTKFGIDLEKAYKVFLNHGFYPGVRMVGVHVHIGSQITQAQPYIKALKKVKGFIAALAKNGIKIKYLNIGGGLGIIYNQEKPQTAQAFAQKIVPILSAMSVTLILEPGRFIVGNAGVLLTEIIYIKNSLGKTFYIVDAAMNDLVRPSLYGAYHNLLPLIKTNRSKQGVVDVVGPICETGDFIAKSRKIVEMNQGDFLSVMSVGAYGFTMASNYNSRARAAEILVKGKKTFVIRKREDYQDLVKKEVLV